MCLHQALFEMSHMTIDIQNATQDENLTYKKMNDTVHVAGEIFTYNMYEYQRLET